MLVIVARLPSLDLLRFCTVIVPRTSACRRRGQPHFDRLWLILDGRVKGRRGAATQRPRTGRGQPRTQSVRVADRDERTSLVPGGIIPSSHAGRVQGSEHLHRCMLTGRPPELSSAAKRGLQVFREGGAAAWGWKMERRVWPCGPWQRRGKGGERERGR
jgi:hypothetical protein